MNPRDSTIRDRLAAGLVAMLATILLYLWVRPLAHPYVDDAGIILKYLDNFRAGHFYAYNAEDGPVFGISGFVHGIVAGLFAWLQIQPEVSLALANAIGSLLFFFYATRIFIRIHGSRIAAIGCVAALVISSEFLPSTFFMGLETPIHLGLIAWMIYEYVVDSRWLPLAGVVVIISKLDGVLLVVVFLVAWSIRRWWASADGRAKRALVWQLAWGFAVPLCVWMWFAWGEFGSPIPQALIAKYYYHGGTSHDSWFPFAIRYVTGVRQAASAWLVLALTFAAVLVAAARKTPPHVAAVLAVGAWVALGQYLVFNPVEQMPWYYTLPEVLFLSAILALPALLRSPLARCGCIALTLGIVLVRVGLNHAMVGNFHAYCDLVETERIQIGLAAGALTPVGGKVAAGHGHVARNSGRYVIDLSGLNSKVVTDYRLDADRIFHDLAPATLVTTHYYPPDKQIEHRMNLQRSFYDIGQIGVPAWRIYTFGKRPETLFEPLTGAEMKGVDRALELDLRQHPRILRVIWGLVMSDRPQTIHIAARGRSATSDSECRVPAVPQPCVVGPCSVECAFENDRGDDLTGLVISSDRPFVTSEPAVVRRIDSP